MIFKSNLSNMKARGSFIRFFILLLHLIAGQTQAQLLKKQKADNVVAEMQVLCRSDAIILKVNTNTPFNGMVYAKDAPNSSNCVSEFNSSTNMTFKLPLKSCGTLFAEADDGIEYFNTVVVQPHMRLMTNQGKGYHVRCKYQTRERTIANTHFNVSASFLMQNNPQTATTPLLATASMPSCTMKIFRSGRDDNIAETVKIGDKLIMVIEIDQQDMYGMKITNCVVRDGMNIAEQQLIDENGCPIDETIMPKFEYTNNSTRASVSFPAHKFPHTSSVYYQCNVRLCINNGGCNLAECPANNAANANPRLKRFVGHDQHNQEASSSPSASLAKSSSDSMPLDDDLPSALPSPDALVSQNKDGANMSFDVYSGLYVNDIDIAEFGSKDKNGQQVLPARRSNFESKDEICLSLGQTGVVILMASITTIGIVLLLVCQVGWFKKDQQVLPRKIFSSQYQPERQHCHHESNRSPRPFYQYDTETFG